MTEPIKTPDFLNSTITNHFYHQKSILLLKLLEDYCLNILIQLHTKK
jgi:hypothetical protein